MVDIPGYRIVRQLGKGGMASVYLAIQESFGRKVALKVMNPALSADAKFGHRFLSEAKIVSQLIHPNIVTVYDVGVSNDQHYLSMEYVPGLDVKTKRPTITVDQSLRIVKDVAKALDYASMKGYVHRDVKPENIMLHDEDGRAVLMDFGIACLADKSSGMTQTGTAIGTPHYMSPEQAKGRAVDSRSDLYSLGVVLYLLVVGRVPYDADSAVAVGIKHISEPIPRLPNKISILQDIIDKLLAKEPSARFQSGAELVAAIEELQHQSGDAMTAIGHQRSPTNPGSHVTEAPTLVSSSVTAAKFNPDNTTMPAIAAVPTPKTQKVRVESTSGQQKIKARSGTQPSLSSISKVNTPVSGVNAVVDDQQRRHNSVAKNSATKKSQRKADQSARKHSNTTGENASVSQKESRQSVTGRNPSVSGQTSAVNVEEKISANAFDNHWEEKHSQEKRSFSLARLFIFLIFLIGGGAAAAFFFKDDLPPNLQAYVDQGEQQALLLKSKVFEQLGLPTESSDSQTASTNGSAASTENTLAVNSNNNNSNTHSSSSGFKKSLQEDLQDDAQEAPINTTTKESDSDSENVATDYEQLLADVPEGTPLAKARVLRGQLDQDLSVAMPLAILYQEALSESPDDQKAKWGLDELKDFHYRRIRETFEKRDLGEVDKYLVSLRNTFPDAEQEEKYLQVLERVAAAEQAQELIARADEYVVQNQLTSPSGANALEFYNRALAVDDDNPIALVGKQKIVQQYETLVSEALQADNYKQAIILSRRGLAIDPNNAALQELNDLADSYFQTEEKIDQYYQEAEKQIATGNLLSPVGESAYDQYKNIIEIDGENSQAVRALRGLEKIVAIEIENKINRSEYEQARALLSNARIYFPNVEKFLALQVSLERSEEADYIASQPVISDIVVSSEPIERIDEELATTSNLDRTIFIGFAYKNFQQETTVVQAVLYDVARSFQIAQVPVVVSASDGFKVFSIDRPVEGFAEGGYNIDLFVENQRMGTLAFRVESNN